MTNYADLMMEQSDRQGRVAFAVQAKDVFDPKVKDVTLFYTIVGGARFKLFRNANMELVFVQVTDDWMRQAKISMGDYRPGLMIQCSWDQSQNTLAVKEPAAKEYQVVKAIQIDN